MKRLIVFQHVAYELLGSLDPLLRSQGFRIRYLNFGRTPDEIPDMSRYDGLIVLGGPMNVDQTRRYPHLTNEVEAIRDSMKRRMPVLGICLGAQLIAKSLGAAVRPNCVKEIGWYDVSPTRDGCRDPLMSQFAGTEKIFQWHGDTFDLPRGSVHLASSRDCPNQAFRFGDAVYGLQFHLEVDKPLIRRWLKTSDHVRELDGLDGRFTPDQISRDTDRFVERSLALGDAVFGQWLGLFRPRARRIALPSR